MENISGHWAAIPCQTKILGPKWPMMLEVTMIQTKRSWHLWACTKQACKLKTPTKYYTMLVTWSSWQHPLFAACILKVKGKEELNTCIFPLNIWTCIARNLEPSISASSLSQSFGVATAELAHCVSCNGGIPQKYKCSFQLSVKTPHTLEHLECNNRRPINQLWKVSSSHQSKFSAEQLKRLKEAVHYRRNMRIPLSQLIWRPSPCE